MFMKIIHIIIFLFLISCTPAHIDKNQYNKNDAANIKIARGDSVKFIFIPSIFGYDNKDKVQVANNQNTTIPVQPGNRVFFVRSNQTDRPFKISREVLPNENICFVVKPNLSSYKKLYYFGNAFTMQEDKSAQSCN